MFFFTKLKYIFINCFRSNQYKNEQNKMILIYDELYEDLTYSDIQLVIDEPKTMSSFHSNLI